jgi:protoheme IX farnesyltransferase
VTSETLTTSAAIEGPGQAAWARTLGAYLALTKPRVMSLLLFTTAAAMVIAAGGMPPLGIFVVTLLGGALAVGGASSINQFMDRDIDQLMARTAARPVATGEVAPAAALVFGVALIIGSFALLSATVNLLAAAFTLAGALFYIFIYTGWLKRSSVHGVVIGGAAGAIPPVVGWAAVRGDVVLLAWLLFATVFIWTPPHFWALSLLIKTDYERAHVPMLPVVRGEDETRRQIVWYSVVLLVFTGLLTLFGPFGWIYLGSALILGSAFVGMALKLLRSASRADARMLFHYSLLYLALLFTAMAIDRIV